MAEDQSAVHGLGDPAQEESARRLAREAVSLALVLAATLGVASLERRGVIPVQGYPSSLLLLLLALAHWAWFRPGLRLFIASKPVPLLPVVFPLALILGVLVFVAASAASPGRYVASSSRLFHLIVLVPLTEELYFRGLLLDHLRRGFSPASAVLLCTLLFGLLHGPVGTVVMVASVLSLFACGLVLHGRSIVYAIQLHVAWNAVTQVPTMNESSSRWIWAGIAVAVIAALAVGSKGKKAAHDPPG